MNWTIVHCREVEAPHHVVLRPLEHHTTCTVLNYSLPVTVAIFLCNRRQSLQPVNTQSVICAVVPFVHSRY